MSLRSLTKLLFSLSMFVCASAFATPFTVDVTGVQSFHAFGSASNTVKNINVGAGATITSVDFNVNLTAYTPSWLSELGLAFTDSAVTDGVLLTPGFGNDNPGTAGYSGTLDLIALGLSFSVGADGILRLEFYEDFDDSAVNPDGIWNFGTVTFNTDAIDVPPPGDVPEPASVLLIGAGMAALGYTARRRRNAAKAA